MAPLVWGETETKRQMFWYTLILIPLTLLPYAFGALGVVYLASAAMLGAIFLVEVLRVTRADGVDEAGVAAVQVLAALSRADLRRDGRRSRPAHLTAVAATARTFAASALSKTAGPSSSATAPVSRTTRRRRGLSARRRRRRTRVSAGRPASARRRVSAATTAVCSTASPSP